MNTVIQFFHRTLWLMMLCYQTKLVCKQISSLEDIVKKSHNLIIYALAVTLTLNTVNQFFLHDTLVYDAA